ncbi:UNVERIFIED_CONTAM: putative cytochrome c biosynthesis ccmC-like mitochondrial protein [Sesamum calycinum]|uniref:Cytochrome c biosynthesis ccmC-like mitochondrial protein n=1 Tax=Sesamum calycinum TaxID=2727403 RepID=A0AAW2LGN2_9LAMI
MGGLTGYLFPQPIRDSVFTERGLEYLSKGHNSTRDKKRRSMVDPPLLPDVLRKGACEPIELVFHRSASKECHARAERKESKGNSSIFGDGYSFKSSGSTLDLQQGGNSRIPYVHVPAARMSILVYIATAINTFLFLLTKHPLFLRFRNRYRNGCFFYVVYLSYWGVSGKTYVGHLLGVGCSFNLCIHLVPYLPGCTVFSKASCRTGSYFNPCWTDRYTNNQVFSQLVEYIASTWEH